MTDRPRYPGDLEAARLRNRATLRRRHRGRLIGSIVVLFAGALLVAAANVVWLHWRAQQPAAAATVADPTPSTSAAPVPTPASAPPTSSPPPPAVPANVPTKGKDTFTYAPGGGPVIGTGTGPAKKYLVAVEDGSGQDVGAFADAVRRILSDPRGWTAGGVARFQQVAKDGGPDFSVTLATQTTVDRTCALGGIHTDGLTSCRLPGQLVINLTRWLGAIPGYGAPLSEYQAFEVNHAVGQELGYPVQACPAPGQPAPVMQKQALGLKGCTANGWPYVNGSLYQGPVVP